MSRYRACLIGLGLFAVLSTLPLPAGAFEVYKMHVTPRSDGVMFGTYPRSGSVGPVTVLQDVGMFPMQRVSWDRWSWIETSPGVYDWNEAEFGILVESHKFGAEAVGSVYMADKIPSFYPQDVNDPTTRAAAADFIKAYYLEMEQRLGDVWVVIDYEMQWYDFAVKGIDPDEWADWYVFLVNEVKSVIPSAKVICDVIADGHGYYLPGEWLTTAMSVSDALGIDDYGATPQIIHDDIQWMIDNYADGKPVYILENGFSTWTGLSSKAHGTEAEQAQYFEDVVEDVMTSFRPQVKSYLQFMYPDAGTGDNIEYHWGLVTQNNGREKPALDVFRAAYADYPPYDASLVRDIKEDLDAGFPETVVWTGGTEFEFLQVQQVLDVTSVVNATLSVDFTNDDGSPNFIVEANGTWKYCSSAAVNVSDYLVHGVNVFNVYFPQERWPAAATVRSVNLVLDTDTDPVKDTFEVYVDDMDLSTSWAPYLNVFPWLYGDGSPLAYDGRQSMGLSYLCSIPPYFGTVTRTFSPAEDWSSFNGFGFYIKGQPKNKDEKIRATLKDASGGLILAWQFFGVTSNTNWTPCEIHFDDVLSDEDMWKLAGVKSLEIAVIGQSRSSGTVYVDDLFCLSRADTFPPLLLSAEPVNPTSVLVRFTEPVTMESVQNKDNYSITDDEGGVLQIFSVVGISDEQTAMIATGAQEAKPYKLHVEGVVDMSENLMTPGLADTVTFRGDDSSTTGLGDGPHRGIWLSAAPNPFKSTLSVDFGFDEGAVGSAVPVTIRVFDVAGRLVRTLAHNASAAGPTRYIWDGRSEAGRRLAAGVYFLRLQAGNTILTRQIVLTK
jgi:hypothetical protein